MRQSDGKTIDDELFVAWLREECDEFERGYGELQKADALLDLLGLIYIRWVSIPWGRRVTALGIFTRIQLKRGRKEGFIPATMRKLLVGDGPNAEDVARERLIDALTKKNRRRN